MSPLQLKKIERILIMAKTYPSPSAKYGETTCVAGITEQGEMRRIYPVPYRMFTNEKLFKKWQWVTVETYYNNEDHRPESRKIFFDKIKVGDQIQTKDNWKERLSWTKPIPQITMFKPNKFVTPEVPETVTLGLFKPKLPVKLEIRNAKRKDWTEDELVKLRKVEEAYNNLMFPDGDKLHRKIKILEKIPYDFYYIVDVNTSDGKQKQISLKLNDWEVCSSYRNCKNQHPDSWQKYFINKIETDMNNKDLLILMGNQHKFEHEWLGISIIYPPKHKTSEELQMSLFEKYI